MEARAKKHSYPVSDEPGESVSNRTGCKEGSQSAGKFCSFIEECHIKYDTGVESTTKLSIRTICFIQSSFSYASKTPRNHRVAMIPPQFLVAAPNIKKEPKPRVDENHDTIYGKSSHPTEHKNR
jgi:hypothetical protein